MALHKLPDFKIDRENPEDGVKELIKKIKPSWKLENLNMQFLSGGYSCKIYRCSTKDDEDVQLTVRVRYLMEDHLEWQDVLEIKAIEHLSTLGHFPTVHAVFANGYCYEYIKGNPVINLRTKTGYINNEILEAIAKEMVFIHSLKIPNTEYKDVNYFPKMLGMIQRLTRSYTHKLAPQTEVLLKEYKRIEQFIDALNMPLALCHGDSHPGNYVWNKIDKKLTFVDWELVFVGYRYYDIAYLMYFLNMFDSQLTLSGDIKLSDNYEHQFLKYYYDTWCKVKNEKMKIESFNEFVSNVRKFKLIPSLAFATFPIFFPDIFGEISGPGEIDRYYEWSVHTYLKVKKEILGSDKFEGVTNGLS